jgi:hypothetical protein
METGPSKETDSQALHSTVLTVNNETAKTRANYRLFDQDNSDVLVSFLIHSQSMDRKVTGL